MFIYALVPRLDSSKIVLNMRCPGMVSTGMSDFLPCYGRFLAVAFKIVKGPRSSEVGGLLIVNAAIVVGMESHGRHLGDKEIFECVVFGLSW